MDSETGFRDGSGCQVWPDGSFYEGFWKEDKMHGFGRMVYADSDIYEGHWKENYMHGNGT